MPVAQVGSAPIILREQILTLSCIKPLFPGTSEPPVVTRLNALSVSHSLQMLRPFISVLQQHLLLLLCAL